MYVFTNAYGEQIAIIAPLGSIFRLNPDGSVTVIFPDQSSYTVPANARDGSGNGTHGYHVMFVPYLGTTITRFGGMGYLITLADGSTRWDNRVYDILEYPPVPPILPPELSAQEQRFTVHFTGYPPLDNVTYTVGVNGMQAMGDGMGRVWFIFPDGLITSLREPLMPGAYSAQWWIDILAPGHSVTHHWAVIPPGSTVTSLGNGWYHVEPSAGSGEQPFDFQSP